MPIALEVPEYAVHDEVRLDPSRTALLVIDTAASAALRWFDVVVPRDAVSALDPFDLEASLRQTAFLFAGRITTTDAIRFA